MNYDETRIKSIKSRYPAGTRIQLDSMNDPQAVESGTLGTVIAVDDAGDLIMKWDNGRSLNLIPGEDSFHTVKDEPALTSLKLYMPMTVDYYERNEWGDYENEPTEMGSYEAVQYADNVTAALLRERHPEEAERGMMTYYDEHDSVDQKVKSYNFTAEVRDGKLWGVAECQVIGELTLDELETLKETASGQASDGLGEGFEQRGIKVGDYELFAHLWSGADSWSIRTEQECFCCKAQETLPSNESEPQMGGMSMQ